MSQKRSSGRTTRMMQDALAAALSGKSVIVLFDNAPAAQNYQIFHNILNLDIRVESANSMNINWETLKINGFEGDVFIDHFAIETRFKFLLKELSRYDSV